MLCLVPSPQLVDPSFCAYEPSHVQTNCLFSYHSQREKNELDQINHRPLKRLLNVYRATCYYNSD
jgi:hypothetical protein